MLDFSKHVIYLSHEYNMEVNNLQLHKVMYFAFKDYIKQTNKDNMLIKEIYNEPFETWRYGPIVPDLYYRYGGYGTFFIPEDNGLYIPEYSKLDNLILKYLKIDVFELIDKAQHEEFWILHQKNNDEHAEYTINDILK